MHVVKYQLQITRDLPELFFKDQGGQQNCMTIEGIEKMALCNVTTIDGSLKA